MRDAAANHVDSDAVPHFHDPIPETAATLDPGHGDFTTREGCGTNKVAAEHVLLASGAPMMIIRAAKVHDAGASNPREWMFLKSILERRPAVFLAAFGRVGDHTTAAASSAALV
ncbi:MAG: hypothetical protein Q4P23_11755 [Micrococcaceae bacterium]|nr:hypothetical protein [Micrococcaceae bacterium]